MISDAEYERRAAALHQAAQDSPPGIDESAVVRRAACYLGFLNAEGEARIVDHQIASLRQEVAELRAIMKRTAEADERTAHTIMSVCEGESVLVTRVSA